MTEPSSTTVPNPFEQTDFGIFYPVGYLVAAFSNAEDARGAQQQIIAKNFDPAACTLHGSEEMQAFLEKNLSENNGFLAKLGKSDDAVKVHLEAAKKGATFLLTHAPDDEQATSALEVLRAAPFDFIHRYHRLAIEEIIKQDKNPIGVSS